MLNIEIGYIHPVFLQNRKRKTFEIGFINIALCAVIS